MSICLTFTLLFLTVNCKKSEPTNGGDGPDPIDYLGQNEPGMNPAIFADGKITTGSDENGAVFSPDGNEIYFNVWDTDKWVIMFMQRINGQWSARETAPFSGEYNDVNPCFSVDGKRIYYSSNRPATAGQPANSYSDLWYVEKTGADWTEPSNLGAAINSENNEDHPFIATDGTLYFTSDRSGGYGGMDIYKSVYSNEAFNVLSNLGNKVNTENDEKYPQLYQDQCLIFVSSDRKDGFGGSDLYISESSGNNSWKQANNMLNTFNKILDEHSPKISPDNKYFFFNRSGDGNNDIYWVDIDAVISANFLGPKKPAFDYIEAWYEGNGTKMSNVIHPALAKRQVTSETDYRDKDAAWLVDITNQGYGQIEDPSSGKKDISIISQTSEIATVKIVSNDFVDYLHEVKFGDRWVIVNVLWEYKNIGTTGSEGLLLQTCNDYIDGWNEADEEKMEEVLHPIFVSRRATSLTAVENVNFNWMISQCTNNTATSLGSREIEILDTYIKLACVKISTGSSIEYLHLAYYSGTWKIVNSLRNFQIN